MKDKIGQEIKVGDLIAYGHALGRCAGLRIGKVLEAGPKLVVWGVDDDWSREKPRLLSKKSRLFYPDRCVVLDWGNCKESIRALLTP